MAVVKFLPRAVKDLLSTPQKVQLEILHKSELLTRFPEMGPRLEGVYQNYRYLLADKKRYRVIYKITSSDLVEIAYIRHCRRQMGLRLIH